MKEAKKKPTAKDKPIKRIADTELKADTLKILNLVLDLDDREKNKKTTHAVKHTSIKMIKN